MKLYKCKTCHLTFGDRCKFNLHRLTHAKDKDLNKLPKDILKLLTCPDCNKVFKSPYLLKKHRILDHETKPARVCEVCGAKFAWKSEYDRHSSTHVNEIARKQARLRKKKRVKIVIKKKNPTKLVWKTLRVARI